MPSVFEVLEEIERRPAMFVGGTDQERGRQLANLETLLNGYALAVRQHHLSDAVDDFPREFSDYLRTQFGWPLECGFVYAIRQASKNDDDAWRTFWTLAKAFRASRTSPR